MHTITCSFQAEEQWKKHLIFAFFTGLDGGWAERLQIFLGIFQGIFFIEKGGFSIYKYLRNQGRKRCKTNVNFQFIVNFFILFRAEWNNSWKKGSIFFCCCSILWKKKGGVAYHWDEPHPWHFSLFFTFLFFVAELVFSVFKWIDCLFVFLTRL